MFKEKEESLFKLEYMNNYDYLNNIIDDNYLEIGKSGYFINKNDVINELMNFKNDRNIEIHNFEERQIDEKTYLIHYITISNDIKYYRTSIWCDNKLLFHQASEIKEKNNG